MLHLRPSALRLRSLATPIASSSRATLSPSPISAPSLLISHPRNQNTHYSSSSSARSNPPQRPAYRNLHFSASVNRAPPVATANGSHAHATPLGLGSSTAGGVTGSGTGNGTTPGSASGSGSGTGTNNGKAGPKKKSGHMIWYREIVPAMLPVLLLSTAIFLSLSLLRTHLSHERQLSDASIHIQSLESELLNLRKEAREAKRRAERERRERERILPLVVERVLQRVGVKGEEEEEVEDDEDRLLV